MSNMFVRKRDWESMGEIGFEGWYRNEYLARVGGWQQWRERKRGRWRKEEARGVCYNAWLWGEIKKIMPQALISRFVDCSFPLVQSCFCRLLSQIKSWWKVWPWRYSNYCSCFTKVDWATIEAEGLVSGSSRHMLFFLPPKWTNF